MNTDSLCKFDIFCLLVTTTIPLDYSTSVKQDKIPAERSKYVSELPGYYPENIRVACVKRVLVHLRLRVQIEKSTKEPENKTPQTEAQLKPPLFILFG